MASQCRTSAILPPLQSMHLRRIASRRAIFRGYLSPSRIRACIASATRRRSVSPSLSGSSEARRALFSVPVLRSQLRNPRGHLIHVPARGTTDLNGLREFAGDDLAVNCGARKTHEFANRPDIEKLWLQSKISWHRPTALCCRFLSVRFLFRGVRAPKRPEQIGYFLDPKL